MKPYGQKRNWTETDQERKNTYSSSKRQRRRKKKHDIASDKWKSRERAQAKRDIKKAKDE